MIQPMNESYPFGTVLFDLAEKLIDTTELHRR